MGEKLLYYKDVYDEDGNPDINKQVTEEIKQMAEIVANNHFGYVGYHDREDLISEGITKGFEMILSCKFDPDRGSQLRNYIYTSMRNEMTNYMYRKKREYPVEEFFGDQKKAKKYIYNNFEIDFNVLKNLILRFKKRYGNYSLLVVNKLKDMGFTVKNVPNEEIKLSKNSENYDNKLLERLVVLSIWKIRESCL